MRKFSRALAVAAASLLPLSAQADWVTEFGFAWKIPAGTSYPLRPECEQVIVVAPEWPENPRGLTDRYSCGGDNPAFIGWPIAWQRALAGPWTIRAGWFHFSHWTDGGSEHELHADMLAVTFTLDWSERARDRRVAR